MPQIRSQNSAGTSSKKKNFVCTNCQLTIKGSFDAYLHPLIKVLICRACHASYGTGDFSEFDDGVDDEGDDNYCRWCVDGGDLFACSNDKENKCHYAFCSDCIKRHVPDDPVLLPAEDMPTDFQWKCYACDPTRIKDLRQQALEAMSILNKTDTKRANNASPTEPPAPTSSTSVTSSTNNTNGASNGPNGAVSNGTASTTTTTSSTGKSSSSSVDKPSTANNKRSGDSLIKSTDHSSSTKDNSDNASSNDSAGGSSTKKRKTEAAVGNTSDVPREPEASSMPPLVKPKPAVSSLRQLNPRSSLIPTKSSGDSSKTLPRPSLPTSSNQKHSSFTDKDSVSILGDNPIIVNSKTSSESTKTNGSTSTAKPQEKPSSDHNTTAGQTQGPNQSNQAQPTKPQSPQVQSSVNKPLPTNSIQKARPHSKQLKQANEQINPSTKVPLSEIELKKRLEIFGQIKQRCVEEIGGKFQNVLEMFIAKDIPNKAILKYEIEDLERPIQEFNSMLRDLRSLYHSQS